MKSGVPPAGGGRTQRAKFAYILAALREDAAATRRRRLAQSCLSKESTAIVRVSQKTRKRADQRPAFSISLPRRRISGVG